METEASEVLNLALFLDPRFKEQYLDGREESIQQITDQCLQYYSTVNDTNEASTKKYTQLNE